MKTDYKYRDLFIPYSHFKKLREAGCTYKEIAKYYGITRKHLGWIRKKMGWEE